MAFGGAGIGHVEGKVCFVPFTAVGDTVKVAIRSEKKSYLEGEIREIIDPSPLRSTPQCPIFGTCGGCDWQHMLYTAQLQAKEEVFAEILWRIARVDRGLIEPVAGAPQPYGYRSRIQLKMRHANGENHIGFFRAGSHYVVDLPGRCPISSNPLNATYLELAELMQSFPEPLKLPQIDLSSGDNGDVILVFHYIGDNPEVISNWLGRVQEKLNLVKGAFLQRGRKMTVSKVYGAESISYLLPDSIAGGFRPISLRASKGGFSQVNFAQNLSLVSTLLEWIQLTGSERVLDLYCGNGNFSLPMSQFAKEVVGLEDFEQSILDADQNRDKNGLPSARFRSIDAVKGLKGLVEKCERFEVVVLDPPRNGASDAVKLIPLLEPKVIVYISCDPSTLARDIAHLKKAGYEVVKSRPVDMFPQTYHIESITMLEKISTSNH